MEGGWMDGWKCLDGGRLDGWMDGVKMRLGSRGSCGSQGWTVPGGSVPVCGSVHGLLVELTRGLQVHNEYLLSGLKFGNVA